MTYATDERLKSFLDTNQMQREGMCLAVMALDRRFSDVRPRHPRGGPDGGRDIQAIFRGKQVAFGAVGFINQANDSDESKKKISSKFKDDIASALTADITPEVFVFFTNVNFTIGEKDDLVSYAKNNEISISEIFDRERIRISLDSPDGLAARFQFLNIALSEAEQATFFARWGSDIQSVITTGFQDVKKTLDQMLFIQESSRVLHSIHVIFHLKSEYQASEIGHLRAFCNLHLKEIKHSIFGIIFGSWDRLGRNYIGKDEDNRTRGTERGVAHGIGHASWENHIELAPPDLPEQGESTQDDTEVEKWRLVNGGSGIGISKAKHFAITYQHDHFIRFMPRLTLYDIDQASIMPIVSERFSHKIDRIEIYANGYKLMNIESAEMMFDGSTLGFDMPIDLDDKEKEECWVRIRPSNIASNFSFDFSSSVPQRIFSSRFVPHNSINRS